MSANNQIVLVASAIAPVAKAPTRTFDSPVTSRHGRFARTIPDSNRSRRSPDGAKYRIPPTDRSRREPPRGAGGHELGLTEDAGDSQFGDGTDAALDVEATHSGDGDERESVVGADVGHHGHGVLAAR
ncbi:hypothetical protein RE9425_04170 [Prescottella equi]|nr:hypothetical protein RE9425_04170 [Prescottella equi]